jgi:hypothetical protein
VEQEVRRLARKLEQQTDELATLFREAAEAEVRYRVEYAKSMYKAPGATFKDREAWATANTAELLLDRKVKEAVAEAAKQSVYSLRDQISAVQSVGAMVRASMGLAR